MLTCCLLTVHHFIQWIIRVTNWNQMAKSIYCKFKGQVKNHVKKIISNRQKNQEKQNWKRMSISKTGEPSSRMRGKNSEKLHVFSILSKNRSFMLEILNKESKVNLTLFNTISYRITAWQPILVLTTCVFNSIKKRNFHVKNLKKESKVNLT